MLDEHYYLEIETLCRICPFILYWRPRYCYLHTTLPTHKINFKVHKTITRETFMPKTRVETFN